MVWIGERYKAPRSRLARCTAWCATSPFHRQDARDVAVAGHVRANRAGRRDCALCIPMPAASGSETARNRNRSTAEHRKPGSREPPPSSCPPSWRQRRMTGQTIMIRTTLPVAHIFIACIPFASSIHDAGAGYPTTMTCITEEFVKGCARIMGLPCAPPMVKGAIATRRPPRRAPLSIGSAASMMATKRQWRKSAIDASLGHASNTTLPATKEAPRTGRGANDRSLDRCRTYASSCRFSAGWRRMMRPLMGMTSS